MTDPLKIDDEILLEDSDEDFQPKGPRITRSNSKKQDQFARKSLNNSTSSVREVEDEFLQSSKTKDKIETSKNASRSAFAAKVKSKLIDENKVKSVLSNINKGSIPSLSRSQSTPASSRNPVQKKKLNDSWKNAQNQMTPIQSSKAGFQIRKVIDVDSDPEDDFKSSSQKLNSSSTSKRLTRNSSKVSLNESVHNNSTKSRDSSIISLEDDEEGELENELAKVEKLKLDLDKKLASINKKGTKITPVVVPPIKKTVSTPKNATSSKNPFREAFKNKNR